MINISIIICTFNRSELLKATLLACDKLAHDINVEVIVVDNNSTDDTEQVVKEWINMSKNSSLKKVYLFEKRQGLSYARNTGVAKAKGQIIAFLDDDAIPCEHWARVIYEAFEKYPDALALGGKILPNFEIDRPEWLRPELDQYISIMNLGEKDKEYQSLGFPYGVNMAFRSKVFSTLSFATDLGRKGGSLLSGEETELFMKIAQQGKIYYIAKMCVVHFIPKERLTQEWFLSRAYAQGVTEVRKNKAKISGVYKLRKLWLYYRKKAHMLWDPRYKNDFQKQFRFAFRQGHIDELLGRSRI